MKPTERSGWQRAIAVLAICAIAFVAFVALRPDAGEPAPTPSASGSTDPCPNPDETIVSGDAGVVVTGKGGSKPTLTIPASAADCRFYMVDLEEGDGEEVRDGAAVTAHYTGYSWTYKELFQSSYDSGEPPTFPLTQVVRGWQTGIPGMKVGGRRLLVIPPFLGYGEGSPGPTIAPYDTLVFVIDLKATQADPGGS